MGHKRSMDTGIKVTIDGMHRFASWYLQLANARVLNPSANNPSAHGFGKGLKKSGIIDHIFTTTGFTVGHLPG